MIKKLNFGVSNNISKGMLVVFIIIILVVIGLVVYKKSKKGSSSKKESFSSTLTKNKTNPLYVSGDILFTQPPGDVKAQQKANVGQGTDGGFFPLHGNGAQIMMANSTSSNHMIPSNNSGVIGGFPNYTGKEFTTRMNGFNNLGIKENDKYSNSYLLNGAHERVENVGQKGPLDCHNWWPHVKENSSGFCTTANDAIATCDITTAKSLTDCKDGKRFIQAKMDPEWKKVV